MTEQTDAAEVEALAREMFDLSGAPENWWVDHRKGYEQHAREIIRSGWLAAREAAAEARGAERALREAADDWHRNWPMRPLKPSDAEWVEDWLRARAAARGAEAGAGA